MAIAQAPLWGLGKVVALEHPQLWGGMLDLAPDAAADEAALLLDEIWDPQGENQLAIRGGQRYVARLVRISPPLPQGMRLQSDGTYLITGGLGGLGLRVAQWIVEQGARYLVLTGRRGASTQAQEVLSKLEQAGARVLATRADVANQEDMVRVLEEINASWPPLRGIVHAAGVLDDGILLQQNRERLTRVMAPKVNGAWNLHVLTQNLPLDFLVLFSSAASLLGSPGQANYAAANAFLDALAHYRRAHCLPGLAIDWGAWSEIGAAAKRLDQMRLKGMGVIAPEQGLEILEQLLGQTSAQVGVAPIDWSQFGADSPFLSEFRSAALPKQQRPSANFVDELAAAPAAERWALLTAHVQAQLAQVLGHGDKEAVPLARGFAELGIDSLTSLELRNRLQNTLGCKLPSTLAFDYPTVEALVDHLVKEVLGIEFAESAASPKVVPRPEHGLEGLSQAESAVLLAQELAAIDNWRAL